VTTAEGGVYDHLVQNRAEIGQLDGGGSTDVGGRGSRVSGPERPGRERECSVQTRRSARDRGFGDRRQERLSATRNDDHPAGDFREICSERGHVGLQYVDLVSRKHSAESRTGNGSVQGLNVWAERPQP